MKLRHRGGFSDTYFALSEAGEKCVLKILSTSPIVDWHAAALEDEADVLAASNHPGLVQLLGRGTEGSRPYLVREQIDGADLRDVWNVCARKGIAIPIAVAVHIIIRLSRIVSDFGRAGFIHANLCPVIVGISSAGEVKLLSAAGVRGVGSRLQWRAFTLYRSYLSPELLAHKFTELDERSDVFVLGIMLWEMLTGRQLFASQDPDHSRRVRTADVVRASTIAPRVSADLDRIVAKALARRRWRRFRTADALASALERYAAGTANSSVVATFMARVFAAT